LTASPALVTVAGMAVTDTSTADRRHLAIEFAGEWLELRACGGLWWGAAGVLIVSDLHLEKASAYAARGQMLPPYDTQATLVRLAALVAELRPTTVICLGDSFHDRHARTRMAAEDIERLRALTAACDWVWIEGNHDPKPPADLGGRAANELRLGPVTFRHEPQADAHPGEIGGHYHPCARVDGRGRRGIRGRCFAVSAHRVVMPAYGALTGGLNVRDPAFAPLFPQGVLAAVLGRDGVYMVGGERLVPDGLMAAG
jgi:DNA ligase-associated metallophosphoesterase